MATDVDQMIADARSDQSTRNNTVVAVIVVLLAVAFAMSIYIQAVTQGLVNSVADSAARNEFRNELLLDRTECFLEILTITEEQRVQLLAGSGAAFLCDGVFFQTVPQTFGQDDIPEGLEGTQELPPLPEGQ